VGDCKTCTNEFLIAGYQTKGSEKRRKSIVLIGWSIRKENHEEQKLLSRLGNYEKINRLRQNAFG